MRDDGGYTPLHHAAARGDNEMIKYLVSKGADVKAVSRRNQTTADMANGPVSRISPFPDTIALLVSLGAKNNGQVRLLRAVEHADWFKVQRSGIRSGRSSDRPFFFSGSDSATSPCVAM